MKKRLIFLMCISILFSGCSNNTPLPIPLENQSGEILVRNQEEISESSQEIESQEETPQIDDPDFRNSNWGDSLEQVKSTESNTLILNTSDSLLYDDAKILGLSCSILYNFSDSKLLNGGYVLSEKHSSDNLYYEDYLKLVKAYTEKYGKPTSSEENWNRSLYKDNPEKIGFAISIGDVKLNTKWITNTSTIDIVIKGDNYKFSTVIIYQSLNYEYQKNTDGI